MSTSSQAQVRISLNLGLPVVQQSWYDNDDDYYFMPEVGVYYNVRRRMYVYPDNGRWMYANTLPGRYNGFSYGSSRYVRVRDRAPFNRHDYYNRQYAMNNNTRYRGNNQHGGGRDRGLDRGDRNQTSGNGGYRGGDNNGGGNRTDNNNNGGWNGGGRGRGR